MTYEAVWLSLYSRDAFGELVAKLRTKRGTRRERATRNVITGFIELTEKERQDCIKCGWRLDPTSNLHAIAVILPLDDELLKDRDGASPVCGICSDCAEELGTQREIGKYVATHAGLIFEEGRA